MPADVSNEQNTTLRRLAEALNISPSDFLEATLCELSETTELLRLWSGIVDVQVRANLLEIMRTMVSHT